ncbi:hypothetical protein TRV_03871 [Trichophyton verrucosum HKI 0517]|uniref:Uncharacterized protein n=1 Tax=Trichophyton verrucosum (strain HKI 0517) TaxID=663202 RepID=D4D9S8_TRIVH|nr:uncharacterized protein TRV_03871 [Trichophyton verrucosum HKI 0517]EFE41392.1 hypothetical protein TRV_03871 [Trichophyton verrucosum HKI 0517]
MLSRSIRRPICSYVCQSCLSRRITPSSTVIRRHNHATLPIQPDASSQSNSIEVKPNEGGSNEGSGAEKSSGGKKKGKGKEKGDANKASKSSKDVPLTQSANTQIAPEVEAKPAKTRKSKSKARKKKAAAQAKNLANLAGTSDENIKNMILIQQKSKLRLKKLRPSKVIAALNLAAQNGKSKSGKAAKGGLDEFAPVRSASPKLTSEVTLGDIEILRELVPF